MSDSSQMWPTMRLSEIADIGTGITLGRELGATSSVEYPYLRVANVQDGHIDTSDVKNIRIFPFELNRYQLRAGDILLTEGGDFDKLGRGAVWDARIPNCLHQNHIFRVRLRNGFVPEFFSAYMGSTTGRAYFLSCAKQTTNLASINKTQLSAMPVPVPPAEAQQRIAEVLNSADALMDHGQRKINKLRLASSMIVDRFLRNATEHASLEMIGSPAKPFLKTGPFGSSLKGEDWMDRGIPVVTIGSLHDGCISKQELLYISETKAATLQDYRLTAGDIVFSRVADVGRSAVVVDDESGWIMSSNLMRISVDTDLAIPNYIQLTIAHCTKVRDQSRRLVNGGGREIANDAIMRKLRLPMVARNDQEHLIAMLNDFKEATTREEQKLSKLNTLKQGLMDDLLTGRVRVNVLAGTRTRLT